MKINFQLKRNGAAHMVFINLAEHEDRQLIATGQRCAPDDWDKERRQPFDQDGELFEKIQEINLAVLKVRKKMAAEEKLITPLTLKNAYQKSLVEKVEHNKVIEKKENADLSAVAQLIKQYLATNPRKMKKSSVDTVKVSLGTFTDFCKEHYPKLNRKNLTIDICQEYSGWLTENEYHDSTHGKKIKHLRWFLRYLKFPKAEYGELVILAPKPDERNIIHLTMDELDALESMALPESVEQQKARDLFLLGCYTGLRVSDLKRINPMAVKNNIIKLTSQKTHTVMSIPVLMKTKVILERYNYSAPNISEQNLNEQIKLICKDAGITEPTEYKTLISGELTTEFFLKYELISSHAAGKTFISLAQEKYGLTPVDIAAIVGKSVKTILAHYLNPNVEGAHKKMLEADKRAQMTVSGGKKVKKLA